MRLSDAIDTILRKEQAGFRPGVECIDHIFTLRNIFEQCIEWNTMVHVNFIDLEKAFDSIHRVFRDTLWNILLAYRCPEKIISIMKLFYNNFTCSVIHKKKLTDWFSVRRGVHQDCVLSPMLFLDILAPEDHKQGTLSKDRTTGPRHGNKAKKMEIAWACYQERPR